MLVFRSLSPKAMFFLQDCGATLRVAIHDAERRATLRLRRPMSFAFVVSPGLFVLAYFAKLARLNEPAPNWREFPWFRLGSSIIAFAVWALCIPGNPFSDDKKPGLGILYGLIAVGLSIVLPSVEAIYQWRRNH